MVFLPFVSLAAQKSIKQHKRHPLHHGWFPLHQGSLLRCTRLDALAPDLQSALLGISESNKASCYDTSFIPHLAPTTPLL